MRLFTPFGFVAAWLIGNSFLFAAETPTPPPAPITPITPVPSYATMRVATVQVRVAPDHRDWSYKLGETARFKITVTADNEPIDNVTVNLTIGPDLFPGPSTPVPVPIEGLMIEGGTMTQPGFLR